jgi:ribosome maturation factor RimP
MGSEVEVRLYQPVSGSKRFVGTLEAYDDGAVTLLLPDKKIRRFEKNQIAQVRLAVSIGG